MRYLKKNRDCIKYLVSQNLALRGHEESLSLDEHINSGNFLSVIKLVAKYDTVLEKHLQNAQENPRSVSYLSPKIQNEFIHLLATTIHSNLLTDVRKAKYYGILVDSTPDLGHREQLSRVIRYVDVDFKSKKVMIREAFLGFVEVRAKDAASLEHVVLESLKSDDISLANCRSQCYDNAAVMTGHIAGLQQRIYARNSKALFVNSDNHSLNLAGVHSAKQDAVVVTFFGTVESIYSFFSRSILRWHKLKEVMPLTVKPESETRWSARSEAVKAIYEGLEELVEQLERMSEDISMSAETRSDAAQLLSSVLKFDFIVLLEFWNTILGKIDRIQRRLQDSTMNFREAATDLECLKQELIEIRSDLSENAVKSAKAKCTAWGIEIERRTRRRKKMFEEQAVDAGLRAEEEITRVMKSLIIFTMRYQYDF